VAIRVENLGAVAYGGLVAASKWWDEQRMADGKLTDKDFFKKMGTYSYLGVGLTSTIMSAFGTWRRQEAWLENVSIGFMYGLPQWLVDVIQSMGGTASKSAAVREAQRILSASGRQLPAGQTGRTYQQEFRKVKAW
jgi:hypothetical protein